MENASKALIMAGGVLLAILVISIALYILASARGLASSINEKNELSAIESFNRYYESFGSKIMGIDVVNIANKVENDIANGHFVTKDYKQSLVTSLSNKLNNKDTNRRICK